MHTPGPWFVDWDDDGGWNHHIMSSPDDRVCFMAKGINVAQQEECNANARLIAAAPELLAALKFLLEDVMMYEAWQRPCKAVDDAKAAIAKSTGAAS